MNLFIQWVFLLLNLILIFGVHAVEIPFRLEEKVVFVKGMINDRGPYTLIVDTGATETVITPPVAKAVGIQAFPMGENQSSGMVRQISVGEASLKNLNVYVFDPPNALTLRLDSGIDYHGILGFTFLSKFLITLDYKNKVLSLDPFPVTSYGNQLPLGKNQVVFDVIQNHIFVQGRIDGSVPLRLMVDTGAANTLILPSIAKKIALKGRPDQKHAGVAWVDSAKVSLGPVHADQVPLLIHTPAHAALYGMNYDGIIGYDLLGKYKVTIDYKNQRMTLDSSQGDRGK